MLGQTVADDVSLFSLLCRPRCAPSTRPDPCSSAMTLLLPPAIHLTLPGRHRIPVSSMCSPTSPADLRRTHIHSSPICSLVLPKSHPAPRLALHILPRSPAPLRDTPFVAAYMALFTAALVGTNVQLIQYARVSGRGFLSKLSLTPLSLWNESLTSDPPRSPSTLS